MEGAEIEDDFGQDLFGGHRSQDQGDENIPVEDDFGQDICGDENNLVGDVGVRRRIDTTTSPTTQEEQNRTCRICMESSPIETTSGRKLWVRPCRCRGTQEYVHLSCLNQWRSTSLAHSRSCAVCGTNYRIHRTTLYQILTDERTAIFFSAIAFVVFCLLSGWTAEKLTGGRFGALLFEHCLTAPEKEKVNNWVRWIDSLDMIAPKKALAFISRMLFLQNHGLVVLGSYFFGRRLVDLYSLRDFLGRHGFNVEEFVNYVQASRERSKNLAMLMLFLRSMSIGQTARYACIVGGVLGWSNCVDTFTVLGRKIGLALGEQILDFSQD